MVSNAVTLTALEDRVRRLRPTLKPDSDLFRTAVLLWASLELGPDEHALSRFTTYPLDWIRPRAERLREDGVWSGEQTRYRWTDPRDPGAEFWIDAGIAEGILTRGEVKSI